MSKKLENKIRAMRARLDGGRTYVPQADDTLLVEMGEKILRLEERVGELEKIDGTIAEVLAKWAARYG